jgi:hypothetical protein
MFAQEVTLIQAINRIYSMGRHTSLICSSSVAVLTLYAFAVLCHMPYCRYVYVNPLIRIDPTVLFLGSAALFYFVSLST